MNSPPQGTIRHPGLEAEPAEFVVMSLTSTELVYDPQRSVTSRCTVTHPAMEAVTSLPSQSNSRILWQTMSPGWKQFTYSVVEGWSGQFMSLKPASGWAKLSSTLSSSGQSKTTWIGATTVK